MNTAWNIIPVIRWFRSKIVYKLSIFFPLLSGPSWCLWHATQCA